MTAQIGTMISRRTALLWLLLATTISVTWGYHIDMAHTTGLWDFRAIYFGARTALDHQNPYHSEDFLSAYERHGGTIPVAAARRHAFYRAVPICVNVPSALLLFVPLALLNWGVAHVIWMVIMPAGLLLSGWLIWDLAGASAPRLTLFLLCVLLANCQLILQGNAAVVVVSLGVLAVWCFLKHRLEHVGVLSLGVALALKPQEIGFVWLCLLLFRGGRRRALQSMGVALALGVISVLWVSSVAPHWFHDWQANLAATTARGDLNDPGPTSFGNDGPPMVISLQAVISCFRDDPQFYNPVTYLIWGPLFLIWVLTSWQVRNSHEGRWMALASIAALGLLPVYHRHYDCKVLLLMIPAAAVVYASSQSLAGKWAAAVTTLAVVLTADVPVAILCMLKQAWHIKPETLSGQVLTVLLGRMPTLVLLVSGVSYLGILCALALRQPVLKDSAIAAGETFGMSAAD